MIICDVDKKKVEKFKAKIKELDPNAFIIIRDTKAYAGGYNGPRK